MIFGAVGLVVFHDWIRHNHGWSPIAVAVTVVGLHISVTGTVLIATSLWLFRRSRFLSARRQGKEAAQAEVVLAGQAIALGLSAGLSPTAAIERTARLLTTDLRPELTTVLRMARRQGLGSALSEASGHAAQIYQVMGTAVRTGGPLAEAVHAVTRQVASDQLAERLVAAKRLPIRLMLPLALAILPGFVLMTLGPVVSATLAQFDF